MCRSVSVVTWFAACVVCLWTGAGLAQPGPSPRAEQANDAERAKTMRDKLAKPVTLEKGLAENTPLRDAVEFISRPYDITILVDTQAFKAEGVDAVEDQPVRLPKMIGIRLSTVLRLLAAQVQGTFLVNPEFVELVPLERARPEAWREKRSFAPTVNAEFTGRPLAEALQELSDLSGINIVVDSRAAENAQTSVTATLSNVPVDTAVVILADMASLRSVPLDNLLYVTSKENADELNAWHDKQYKKGKDAETSPAGPNDSAGKR